MAESIRQRREALLARMQAGDSAGMTAAELMVYETDPTDRDPSRTLWRRELILRQDLNDLERRGLVERVPGGRSSSRRRMAVVAWRRCADTQGELALLRHLRDAVEDELDIYTRPKVRAALAALQEHEHREGGTDAR